ncbi:hypothetical protein [Salinispora pacifica]|uniref:hypothetical protein n=1 Tax=Salinispora pacifica TaxID=351187 RepID=UPI00048311B5|nr:hypothetical protein [Salinispora pacifica]
MRRRADQIIDAGVQLHVEATTLMYIELGKDLMLLKFLDLVELARRLSAQDLRTLVERTRRYGCAESAYYALYHARLLYPADVPAGWVETFAWVDPEVIEVYGVLDNDARRWERSFAERFFDSGRWRSLTAHSTVPGPRAVV